MMWKEGRSILKIVFKFSWVQVEGGRTESQAWYLYTHNPAPGKQQDSHKFEASLDYSIRVCLKKQIKMRTQLARVLTDPLRKMR